LAIIRILGTKAELKGSSSMVASLLSSFIAANNTTASFEGSCIITVVATIASLVSQLLDLI
jgi:hypothetical protein